MLHKCVFYNDVNYHFVAFISFAFQSRKINKYAEYYLFTIFNFFRDLQEGWQAELGPMRIPMEHKFTLELAKRAGLEVKDFQSDSSPFHFFIRDHKIRKSDMKNAHLKNYYDEYEVPK